MACNTVHKCIVSLKLRNILCNLSIFEVHNYPKLGIMVTSSPGCAGNVSLQVSGIHKGFDVPGVFLAKQS